MDKLAHVARRHTPVAKHVIDARIDRHDRVKDAGLKIRIELNQISSVSRCSWFAIRWQNSGRSDQSESRPARRNDEPPTGTQPANGCLTVSFCELISLGVGKFFIARTIESLVAS